MSRTIRVKGVYGGADGKSADVMIALTFAGSPMRETLTVAFEGKYQVRIPYRPVEQLIAQTKEEVRRALAEKRISGAVAVERSIRLNGSCAVGRELSGGCVAAVWFRGSAVFEMLTVEVERLGQISVPYSSLRQLIREERRGLV